jgi:hypothetical protein
LLLSAAILSAGAAADVLNPQSVQGCEEYSRIVYDLAEAREKGESVQYLRGNTAKLKADGVLSHAHWVFWDEVIVSIYALPERPKKWQQEFMVVCKEGIH